MGPANIRDIVPPQECRWTVNGAVNVISVTSTRQQTFVNTLNHVDTGGPFSSYTRRFTCFAREMIHKQHELVSKPLHRGSNCYLTAGRCATAEDPRGQLVVFINKMSSELLTVSTAALLNMLFSPGRWSCLCCGGMFSPLETAKPEEMLHFLLHPLESV